MKNAALFIAYFFTLFLPINGQSFSSGSTGADGALNLSTSICPGGPCEVQLPESGILNYTTVNIPSGVTLRFKPNFRNTPAILLVQGNVTIGGVIDVRN